MGFWNFITGTTPQAEQDQQLADKKAAYEAALQRRQDAGTITPEQVAADQAYVSGIQLEDTDAGAAQGFKEGLQEGFNNVLSAPGKAVGFAGDSLGSALWGILKNIPWWLYIGAAAAVFLYFGGAALLARKLIKR
jgi:hypothetical protein